MNKQKIIFIIIAAFFAVLILIMAFMMRSSSDQKANSKSWELKIWIFQDDKVKFEEYLSDFQKASWNKFTPIVESFSDRNEYNLALNSAFSRWVAPDVFVLNNNEKSIFLENISWIDPALVNPTDFRKNYESFFADDLITTISSKDKKQEFLAWIPIWYETLWIYYNRAKWIEASDLETWWSLKDTIIKQKEKNEDIVPLWIWKWTTVEFVSDIVTAFFMLENAISLEWITDSVTKSALSTYFSYSDTSWDNWYNDKFESMLSSAMTNLDLFSRWDISMVIAYPRTLLEIDKKWSSKKFLYARPFPEFFMWSWKWFVNYNYFVVNKNAVNDKLAMSFMKYISSETWSKSYLDKFSYYIPSQLSLKSEYLEKDILDWYNIKLKDFDNDALEKNSFDKWIKTIYDEKMVNIADDEDNYVSSFTIFKDKLICVTNKITKLENLSESCIKKDK